MFADFQVHRRAAAQLPIPCWPIPFRNRLPYRRHHRLVYFTQNQSSFWYLVTMLKTHYLLQLNFTEIFSHNYCHYRWHYYLVHLASLETAYVCCSS